MCSPKESSYTNGVSTRIALIAAVLSLSLKSRLTAQQAPSVQTIIQRSVEANKRDWKADPDYDCLERDLDPDGHTKTYDDLMIFGSPYQKLVAVDGKPLPKQRQGEEAAKLSAEISHRKNESHEQRRERIVKYEKDRERDHQMMEQLTEAFDFTLIGERKLGPNNVYLIKATPKPTYQPPNIETQALKGMEGRLWIDQQSFQWVKVEAHVMHPVSIEGFLAQVEPGTRFELEKGPVAQGVWLPKHYAMKAHAKVLFLIPHQSQDDETYYNYRKASTDPALRDVPAEPGPDHQ